jgi:hypothetical protein
LQEFAGAISCYPNPTDGNVTISPQPFTNLFHLTVANALGQILINKNIAPGFVTITFDLSGFVSGIYHVRISDDTTVFEQSIVKR